MYGETEAFLFRDSIFEAPQVGVGLVTQRSHLPEPHRRETAHGGDAGQRFASFLNVGKLPAVFCYAIVGPFCLCVLL